MTNDEALAKLLGRKLSQEERTAIEKGAKRFNAMRANSRLEESLRRLRDRNPAAVSPHWGMA